MRWEIESWFLDLVCVWCIRTGVGMHEKQEKKIGDEYSNPIDFNRGSLELKGENEDRPKLA